MITCVTGLPGEGKTLFVVWMIKQFVDQGRIVATNIQLTKDHPSYADVLEIGTEEYPILGENKAFWTYLPKGCVIVIDEADVYFDSVDHGKMSRQSRIYFKQHRKRGDTLILTVQRPANLYVRIRRLVGEWVWCRRDGPHLKDSFGWVWFLIPKRFYRFRRTSFAGEKMHKDDFIRSSHFTQAEAEVLYDWYTTEQLIGTSEFFA